MNAIAREAKTTQKLDALHCLLNTRGKTTSKSRLGRVRRSQLSVRFASTLASALTGRNGKAAGAHCSSVFALGARRNRWGWQFLALALTRLST